MILLAATHFVHANPMFGEAEIVQGLGTQKPVHICSYMFIYCIVDLLRKPLAESDTVLI